MQAWPAFRNLAFIRAATAAGASASSNTRKGALPPSSSDNRFNVAAEAPASLRPTLVEPLNDDPRARRLVEAVFEAA